jgi:polysaccharide biosynthesis protein PslH
VIYSRNMIQATAAAGADLHVLLLEKCLATPPKDGKAGITWLESGGRPNPDWMSLFSSLPNIAKRFSHAAGRKALSDALGGNDWDAIVFDNIAVAGYLATVLRWMQKSRRHPVLFYLAHNHETSTRWSVAANEKGSIVKRLVLSLDAVKVSRLEKKLIGHCPLISANTEYDRSLFLRDRYEGRCVVLMPAYDGPRLAARDLAQTERVVIVLGSYQWKAKRQNIEDFLDAAAAIFPQNNIILRVVGFMSEAYRQKLTAAYPWARIVGSVDDVERELDLARIGVVPEVAGGGFKHKILNYVFNRVAVAGITAGLTGVGLRPDIDCLSIADMRGLVGRIVEMIDRLPQLEAMTANACENCKDRFSWLSRGEALVAAIVAARADAKN